MKKYIYLSLLFCSFNISAVHVNHQGLGDVSIIPYYTVNNDLNTLVSVTNTTDNSKALKVNIREGLNGHAVLSYNVYLNAFDTWTFAFVANTSTITGYEGQDSVIQYSTDTSCAPFLQKSGQEFLPFELTDGLQNMSRVREGYIEIIEMGELQGDFVAAADHGFTGVPADCAAFENAWQSGGVWHAESGGDVTQDLTPGTGGLMVEADIINVAEGINYSIPVVALADFFAADTINHANPGDTSLSLDAAAPQAIVITDNDTYKLSFDSGIDAVSAVLMSNQLYNTYALDGIVAGKSETVFSQPTRRFYVDLENDQITAPYEPLSITRFSSCTDEQYSGSRVNQIVVDRESQQYSVGNNSSCFIPVEICGAVHIQKYTLFEAERTLPEITGSKNFSEIATPFYSHSTENGFNYIEFTNTALISATDINSNETVAIKGLPVLGVALNKFSNAGAAEGLLAQYGSSHAIKSKALVIKTGEDSIKHISAFDTTSSDTTLKACSQIK